MAMLPKKVNALTKLFSSSKPLIGTIHCSAFPGSPRYQGESMKAIIQHAVEEARAYAEGGMNGIIVENSWDLPFLRPEDVWYETVATMSVVADSVREAASVPIGINVLANAGEAAIAVAKASRASFIRVNQWVNAYVSNEGIVQGNSARILRYRSVLQANDVAIFADVHVKHGAHAIVADRPVEEQARDAEFFDADVTIATGNHTGDATPIDEIESVRRGTYLPVLIGSGLSVENAVALLERADGAIVGTSLKHNGEWWGRVSLDRVRALVQEVSRVRLGS
ncbi:MAG: BtpA/SgcQ family protein [Verrucomicrobia bacterium]|nr:BtpA/SgcQ family protein [Verrucomicrobiota bacterium]